MKSTSSNRKGQSSAWSAVLGAAAIGTIAAIAISRIRAAQHGRYQESLDSAVKLCDNAVEALEKRLNGKKASTQVAS